MGFIVCVTAATTLVAGLHPQAPARFNTEAYLAGVQTLMTLSFAVGIFSLLTALAAGGWVRSRTMGWVTTGVSLVGFAAVLFLTVRVDAEGANGPERVKAAGVETVSRAE